VTWWWTMRGGVAATRRIRSSISSGGARSSSKLWCTCSPLCPCLTTWRRALTGSWCRRSRGYSTPSRLVLLCVGSYAGGRDASLLPMPAGLRVTRPGLAAWLGSHEARVGGIAPWPAVAWPAGTAQGATTKPGQVQPWGGSGVQLRVNGESKKHQERGRRR
jgi:hypothetical protein